MLEKTKMKDNKEVKEEDMVDCDEALGVFLRNDVFFFNVFFPFF